MPQSVFVKVVGFSTVERHTLNTVFRLSEERDCAYVLWTPGASDAPRLLLVDGSSPDAQAEVKGTEPGAAKIIWVGAAAAPQSWRVFARPISWPQVIGAMDEVFAPAATGPGFDLDLGGDDSGVDTLPPDAEPPMRRALIVSADRDQRLYLRARLALAGMTTVDEAQNGAEAVELARLLSYCVALVDHGLPGVDGWQVVKSLHASKSRPYLVLATADAGWRDRLRAWHLGADTCLGKPLEPGRLQVVLDRVVAKNRAAPAAVLAAP
jgi:CheY-like chemotaxis protein